MMKLQIFITDGHDKVLVDREYLIAEDRSPFADLQDLVDDAAQRLRAEQEEEMNIEAQRLINQDKAES